MEDHPTQYGQRKPKNYAKPPQNSLPTLWHDLQTTHTTPTAVKLTGREDQPHIFMNETRAVFSSAQLPDVFREDALQEAAFKYNHANQTAIRTPTRRTMV